MSFVMIKGITTIESLHNLIEEKWTGSSNHEVYMGMHDDVVVEMKLQPLSAVVQNVEITSKIGVIRKVECAVIALYPYMIA